MPTADVEGYFRAWNARDLDALKSAFAETGLYRDPSLRLPAHPYDLGPVMDALDRAVGDYRFEIGKVAQADGSGAASWTLAGANMKGWKPGIEPTGRRVRIEGVDWLTFEDGRIVEAVRTYDQKSLYEQIGMQVIVEPQRQRAATFGYSKRVASGNPNPPAALATTWIEFRDQSELDHIRAYSSGIIEDFLHEDGFISIVTGAAGPRAFTATAWDNEQALYRALERTHAKAKQDFRTGDLSPAVWTAVWRPAHINRLWLRCPRCAQPNDMTEAPRTCVACGEDLPPQPSYW